jgi:hypothetical protein
LGVTPNSITYFTTNPALNEQSGIQVSASGVVHQGATPIDTSAPALTLTPGDYQAQMYFRQQGASCTNGVTIPSAVLSVLILSSVYDRIYADGFA